MVTAPMACTGQLDRQIYTRHPTLQCITASAPPVHPTHLPHGAGGLQPLLEVRLDGSHQLLLLPLLQLRLAQREGGRAVGGVGEQTYRARGQAAPASVKAFAAALLLASRAPTAAHWHSKLQQHQPALASTALTALTAARTCAAPCIFCCHAAA